MEFNIKHISFLFVILTLIITLGTISATNDTQTSDVTTVTQSSVSDNIDNNIEDVSSQNSIQKEITSKNKITQEANTTTTKKSSKKAQTTDNVIYSENTVNNKKSLKTENSSANQTTSSVNVNSYTQLVEAFDNAKNSNDTKLDINLEDGDYQISQLIVWSNATGSLRNISINGNNVVFNGYNNSSFLEIGSDYQVTLNNITISNVHSTSSFTIANRGILIFNNVKLNNTSPILSGSTRATDTVFNIYNSTIANCNFTSYGGAIIGYNGEINIYDSIFKNNTVEKSSSSDGMGGVIYTYNAELEVANSLFTENYGKFGGAIYASGSYVLINSTNFTFNKGKYGAAVILNASVVSMIKNCNFINNTAESWGGAIGLTNVEVLIVNNTLFENNTSTGDIGGSIYSRDSLLVLDNSTINNSKAQHGGAIVQLDNTLNMTNTKILNSQATKYDGGAIYSMYAKVGIVNSTIVNNTAKTNGGAIAALYDNLAIINTIFSNNTAVNGSNIYSTKSNVYVMGNVILNDNKSDSIYSINDYVTNYNQNWWGMNNPEFNKIFTGVNPNSWIIMTFNVTEEDSDVKTLEVALNTLSNGKIYNDSLPTRTVTFTSDNGTFSSDTLNIDSNVTNNYTGNIDSAIATIDSQTLKITSTLTPYLQAYDVSGYAGSSVEIIAVTNNDATGTYNIEVNGNIIATGNVTDGIIKYTYTIPSAWNQTTYNIMITYMGNQKYSNKTTSSTLTILKEETKPTISITTITKETPETNITLPSRYDLRDYGQVTPVKDQAASGSCWAFASVAALESAYLKQTNTTYDFSEDNLKNLLKLYSLIGSEGDPATGGNVLMGSYYFLSWIGPVLEADDPYDDFGVLSAQLQNMLKVQDTVYIPDRTDFLDNDGIKKAVMEYGAVATLYYADFSYYDANYTNYYYDGEVDLSTGIPNHAIVIVGWDDNYSASNFKITPPGDGAFIIKNSWGVNVSGMVIGDGGYQYISYYDKTIAGLAFKYLNLTLPGSNTAFIISNDTYKSNYQHDLIGSTDDFTYEEDTIYYKNVFTAANDNETIKAFGTFFEKPSAYTVKLYINGKLQLTQTGTVTQSGYKTIKFDKQFPIYKSDEFTVEIKLTTLDGSEASIIVQNSSEFKLDTQPGQSYVSSNGLNWTDLHYYATPSVASLKVYTIDTPTVSTTFNSTAIKAGDTIKIVTKTNNTLANGKVVYKLNGITLKDENGNPIIVKLVNNTAELTYTIPNLKNSNYTLTTLIVTDDQRIDYNSTLYLTKDTPKVTISTENIIRTTNTTIVGQITVNDTLITEDTKVAIKLNGITLAHTTAVKGIINTTIKTDTLKNSNYTLTVVTEETAHYSSTTTNKTLTVEKQTPTITLNTTSISKSANTTIVGQITAGGKLVTTTTSIAIKINGITFKNVKVVNGIINVTIPTDTLKNKNYTLTVVAGENSNYNSARVNKTLAVI